MYATHIVLLLLTLKWRIRMPSLQEIDAQIAELEKQKKNALAAEKNKDLSVVKELCKKHGFTARMLKGYLGEGRNRRTKEELAQAAPKEWVPINKR